jgi:hypothetical protein
MKNTILLIVVLMFAAVAGAQSLGDVARQTRTEKKAPAVFHVEGQAYPPEAAEPAPDKSDSKKDAKTDAADNGGGKSADEKSAGASSADGKSKDEPKKSPAELAQKKAEDWNKKLDAEKSEISNLQRELDVSQREQRLRAAAYYGDAGTQMRDQAKFAEDSRKQQEEIDAKKQALDAARNKLGDMQEQARKEGVSNPD